MITPPTIPAGAIELGTLQIAGPFERPHYKGPYAGVVGQFGFDRWAQLWRLSRARHQRIPK